MTAIGVSTWVWTSPIDDAGLAALAPMIADQGFDLVELPIESVGDWDPERTADVVHALGLGVTAAMTLFAMAAAVAMRRAADRSRIWGRRAAIGVGAAAMLTGFVWIARAAVV